MSESTPPSLYSTIYTSAEAVPFSDDDLSELLVRSRVANDEAGITGVLLYRRGRFVQYLEGEETAVRDALQRIGSDPRHRGVRVLVEERPAARHFAHWTMGFISDGPQLESMPIGFRVAFNDLDTIRNDEDATAVRALRELSLWFRGNPQ